MVGIPKEPFPIGSSTVVEIFQTSQVPWVLLACICAAVGAGAVVIVYLIVQVGNLKDRLELLEYGAQTQPPEETDTRNKDIIHGPL
jgi:hypothetical protein